MMTAVMDHHLLLEDGFAQAIQKTTTAIQEKPIAPIGAQHWGMEQL